MQNSLHSKVVKGGLALCAGVVFTQLAWAQPDLNNAPKGDNPPENTRQPRARMTAEERKKAMEDRMREMLGHVGVNDGPTQDAILAYVQADTEARQTLNQQTRKLFQALNNGGVTDDQLLALVTDVRASQEAEKVRREKAQADLDAKIHYLQNPRLEAILLLAGLIGDGQGGAGMLMGGMGGRGGGMGGGNFGGRNGANAGGAAGGAAGGNMQQRREEMQKRLLQRFDKNANGKLDDDEQAELQKWRQERQQLRQQNGNQPNVNPNANQPNGDAPPNAGNIAMPDDDDLPNA